MDIISVKHIDFAPGHEHTTLTLAEDAPAWGWRAVVIDGERVEPVFDSSVSDRSDRLTIPGIVRPSLMQVEFVV